MASFIRRCTFEPGLQKSWDRSIGESRKVQDAGFLLRSFLQRGLQGPLGLREARSLLRSFLSVIAGGSFLFGRSLDRVTRSVMERTRVDSRMAREWGEPVHAPTRPRGHSAPSGSYSRIGTRIHAYGLITSCSRKLCTCPS